MKRKGIFLTLGVLAIGLAVYSVQSRRHSDDFPPIDSWWSEPPEDFRPGKESSKPKHIDFFIVAEPLRDKAIKLLANSECVQLDAAQEKTWVTEGKVSDPKHADGTTPFLVRGLMFNEGSGGFSVSAGDEWISILHYSLGHHYPPMKRAPLVVYLPKKPAKVFVTCGMAE